jgi:hypothetical protein
MLRNMKKSDRPDRPFALKQIHILSGADGSAIALSVGQITQTRSKEIATS